MTKMIEVEKLFLMKVLKQVTLLRQEVKEIKKEKQFSETKLNKSIELVGEIDFNISFRRILPDVENTIRMNQFSNDLKELIRKYRLKTK